MAGPSGGLEAPGSTDILDTTAAGAAAIRGAALRILGYGIGVGLSVVGAALLIRHLGPADFGRFTAAVSLVTIFATLAEAGMTNLGVREYSLLPPGRREAFVGGLAGLRIATTAVGVLVAVAIAVAVGYDGEMVAGTAIVGFGCLLLAAQSTWVVPLLTQLRLGWVTALELVRQAATVAATALFVIVGASLVPFFWVVAISTFAALLVTVPLVRGLVVFTPSLRDTDWRRLLALPPGRRPVSTLIAWSC